MIALLALLPTAAASTMPPSEVAITPDLWEATVTVAEPVTAEFEVVHLNGAAVLTSDVIVRNIDGDAFAIADVDAEALPGDEDYRVVSFDKDVRIVLDVDTTAPGLHYAEMDVMLEDAFDCGVRVVMRVQVLEPEPDPDDLDGDGWTTADGDCQPDDPWTSPGSREVCDSVDNDCDGAIDEVACESSAIACPEDLRARGCASSPGGGAWLAVIALSVRRRRAGSR